MRVERRRFAFVTVMLALVLAGIGGQLLRLTVVRKSEPRVQTAEPISRTFSRPDIVDRNGRLIATDVAAPSLYADPSQIMDLDETIERLAATLPELDESELRRLLADRGRRFVWIRRGLAPIEAQRVHDLGLPGLGFRREPKRVYPTGLLTGHVLGHVNVDNKGAAGIERHIDDTIGLQSVSGPTPSAQAAVRLSIDLGAQHAVADELKASMTRYLASAASALVMDVATGEIVAAVSLPAVDSNKPTSALDSERVDRLHSGVYELGSIFKTLTVAMAMENRVAGLDSSFDVAQPIEIGRYKIKDHHGSSATLSVRDIFLHSSNVGAGRLALATGIERQKSFMSHVGLTSPMRTEVGPVAMPLLPQHWGEIESVTIGYGHGIAVAPIQFAAAAATLVNGGWQVSPTFLGRSAEQEKRVRLLSPATSAAQREIWRMNVTASYGTGRRAEVAGLRIGGKTGTAEMPGRNGYRAKAVIASFVAAMPMDAPRYVSLVTLFEPQGTDETKGQITAAYNAAPATARILARVAPILDILPKRLAGAPESPQGTKP